ncbi:MAG: hypothetical protein ACOYVK_17700 [Bacillota bacterium]
MELIGKFIFWTFFLFGVIDFFYRLLYECCTYQHKRKEKKNIFLIIKDEENAVEGILRVLNRQGIEIEIIDCQSEDETEKIVELLSRDVKGIHLLNKAVCESEK